jgi:excisionase family DNA binding protein
MKLTSYDRLLLTVSEVSRILELERAKVYVLIEEGMIEAFRLGGHWRIRRSSIGSTPFRLVTHVGDVGHTLILGPSGAGKSVLLNVMEAQFLRYPGAQVYIFDKGGSARALTAGVGGDYYDLGAEDAALAFQPLAEIDQEGACRWAHEWPLEILARENVTITSATTPAVCDSARCE